MGSVVEEVSMKKKKKKKKWGVVVVEKFFHFPEEIILDMISRLPFESVLHCRLICKTWRNLIRDPSFAQMHLLRHHQLNYNDQNVDASSSSSAASSGMMGFIFLSGSSKQGKKFHYLRYYYDCQDHSHHQTLITNTRIKLKPPLDDYLIVGSCNGLVCVSVNNTKHCIGDPVYICNPLTREYVILPSLHNIKHKVPLISGFGYHPSTNEYKVVRICRTENEPRVTNVQVYTLGDCINGWRDKGEITFEVMPEDPQLSLGILANGALHWVYFHWEANKTKIVGFDLVDEIFRVLPLPPFLSYSNMADNYFELRVFRGSLCALYHIESGCTDVWSFKKKKKDDNEMNEQHEEYYKHWSWSKDFHLEQEILFSNKNAVALTESGEVLLYDDPLSLYSYDVKTATSEKLVEFGFHSNLMPHINSFVSLKALGEKEVVIESAAEGTSESEISTLRRSARLKRLRHGLQ